MQMNEITVPGKTGSRLPNRQQAASNLRDSAEKRAERPASRLSDRIDQDPEGGKTALATRKPRRYGAGF